MSDDTFAGTLTGIERLRNSRQSDDDWIEWKRVLIESAKAGAELERIVSRMELRLQKLASQTALDGISARVKELEDAARRRDRWGEKLLKAAGAVGVTLLAWWLGRHHG